jgi:multidrug efflux pump subunit AcrB
VRWILGLSFLVSLVASIVLWSRMRDERRERHSWKGFAADMPDDISGLEQWDRDRYSPAGKRLYPWFLASSLITLVLFVVSFVLMPAA